MSYEFTPLVLPYVTALVVTSVLWARLYQHRERRAAKGFLLDVSGVVLLSVVVSLKILATDLDVKVFWWNWRFLAVSFMSIGYLLMAIEYTDREDLVDRRLGVVFGIIVVLTQVAVWTNGRVGPMYTVTGLQDGLLVPSFGPLYWVYATVMVGMLAIGVAFLLRLFAVRRGLRVQTTVLVGTIMLVMAGVVVWWLRIVPLDTLALTSAVKVLGFYVAVDRLQLLETLPVARTTVLRNMEDAVFVLNDHGQIIDMNPAARALVGDHPVTGVSIDSILDVEIADVVGTAGATTQRDVDAGNAGTSVDGTAVDGTADDAASNSDDDAASTSDDDAADDSSLANREVMLSVDGELRYFDLELSKFPDGTGLVAVFRDITERRNREQELTILNRIVRHDIRNEMNVLYGHGQALEPHVDDDARADYELVMESATHVVEITDTIRDLMETITSGGSMEGRAMSLQSILEAEVAKIRSNFPDANVHLEAPPNASVYGNEMLSSVFANLLHNAVRHNDADTPNVWVRTTVDEADGSVRVTVADDGPGVPPEEREAIFGRGKKGLGSEGSGVGLYLVDAVTSAFDGDVWIEDAPEGGAAFVVQLELVSATQETSSDRTAARPDRGED